MKLPTGGNFVKAPAGTHMARLVQIIDLGTQHQVFQNEEKDLHQIRFGWELVNETAVFAEGEAPRPFLVTQKFTASMNAKASLRLALENWRGKAYTEAEAAEVDLLACLGKPAMISLAESKDGKYTNVKSVAGVPRGTEVKAAVNELLFFDLDQPDWKVYDKLGQKTREMIALSPEYKAVMPI